MESTPKKGLFAKNTVVEFQVGVRKYAGMRTDQLMGFVRCTNNEMN